jgi:hypothetical protein
MFLENSRYFRQPLVEGTTSAGQPVKAIALRRLPTVNGEARVIQEKDRLDIMAQRQYLQPTWFWHIADANSELEANELVKKPLRTIIVPGQ